mgnify:FL=1
MLEKIREFVKREPVRVVVHGLVLSTIAGLVASGKVDAEVGDLLVAGLLYVLFGAGAEVARSQVTPVSK